MHNIAKINRRWICSDVWMDIFPLFDRAQLGLNLALLSDRFDILVDKHFDGRELTIWREIKIDKDFGSKAKLCAGWNAVEFLFSDHPLPNKIRFNYIRIKYIDHSVLAFLHANKQIWDRKGTNLNVFIWSNKTEDDQPIWDAFAHEIFWPIFATNIRQLGFISGDALDNLCSRTSPTILTDLDQLNLIYFDHLYSDTIDNQILSKWLHSPSKDGQPKRLRFRAYVVPPNLEWLNNFRETFPTTSSVSYTVHFTLSSSTQIVPFDLVNERTKEKLTLMNEGYFYWLLKRSPISEKAATNQWENCGNLDANLNNIQFIVLGGSNCIGPLSPPAEEGKEEAN